jgi:hypothetical protein
VASKPVTVEEIQEQPDGSKQTGVMQDES